MLGRPVHFVASNLPVLRPIQAARPAHTCTLCHPRCFYISPLISSLVHSFQTGGFLHMIMSIHHNCLDNAIEGSLLCTHTILTSQNSKLFQPKEGLYIGKEPAVIVTMETDELALAVHYTERSVSYVN